jgi:hypothetical protein
MTLTPPLANAHYSDVMDPSNDDLLLNPSLKRNDFDSFSSTKRGSLLADAPALAARMLHGEVDDRIDASIIFNNVAQIMAIALRHHDAALFRQGVEGLVEIWKEGNFKALYPLTPPDFEASLWENLGINLYVLGGLAVASERWSEIRELTNQAPTGGSGEKSWLRQGQVISARSSTDYDRESILGLAAQRLGSMEPEISETDAIQYLARFDLLSGLIIGEEDLRGFYPNAAEFSEELVEPFVIEQLRSSGSPLREHVFKEDTPGLLKALEEYDRVARLQAALARYKNGSWKWHGFSDARTLVFLAEEHMLEEWAGAGS